ncbi:MAG TPA: hypothetical protein V6C81_04385 [Planktothrix sp.]|jgi:hypothetical protein
MKRLISLLSLLIVTSVSAARAEDAGTAAAGDAQVPANSGMLRATVQDTEMQGEANGAAEKARPDLRMQRDPLLDGQAASTQAPVLPGSLIERAPMRLNAEKSVDPDKDDRDMMLAWDKWRNHFAHTVWQHYCENLMGPGTVFIGSVPIKLVNAPSGYMFQNGLHATYSCVVTSDRRILAAHITRSSGNPDLDAVILKSVESMSGKHSLTFPKGSRRQAINETESLGTGANGWQGHAYNDVERYSAPNN